MPNDSYSPMDSNQDGLVSNVELATAADAMNDAVGTKKHPFLGRVLLAAVILLIGGGFIFAGVNLLVPGTPASEELPDILKIGIVIVGIGLGYLVAVIAGQIRKKRNGGENNG